MKIRSKCEYQSTNKNNNNKKPQKNKKKKPKNHDVTVPQRVNSD